MVGRIRSELERVRRGEPGSRFERTHERNRIGSRVLRLFVVAFGVLLIVGAGVFFWLPGPQVVIALFGLALVTGQSETVARLMDRAEVAGRRLREERWKPYPHKRLVLFGLWCAFSAAALAVFWGIWQLGLLPGWLPVVG